VGETSDIGELLRAWGEGDRTAFDRLVPLVYPELRRIARNHLRRTPRGQTLDTTALVNEAYVKLARDSGLQLADRGHLLAVFARAVRQVIITRARARVAQKRGGGQINVTLDEERVGGVGSAEWLLDLDRALTRLGERDERLARVVDCRFFAGMSEEETCEALGISLRTAQRDWMRARAWLRSELEAGPGSDADS